MLWKHVLLDNFTEFDFVDIFVDADNFEECEDWQKALVILMLIGSAPATILIDIGILPLEILYGIVYGLIKLSHWGEDKENKTNKTKRKFVWK
jgi:hypothetical protein